MFSPTCSPSPRRQRRPGHRQQPARPSPRRSRPILRITSPPFESHRRHVPAVRAAPAAPGNAARTPRAPPVARPHASPTPTPAPAAGADLRHRAIPRQLVRAAPAHRSATPGGTRYSSRPSRPRQERGEEPRQHVLDRAALRRRQRLGHRARPPAPRAGGAANDGRSSTTSPPHRRAPPAPSDTASRPRRRHRRRHRHQRPVDRRAPPREPPSPSRPSGARRASPNCGATALASSGETNGASPRAYASAIVAASNSDTRARSPPRTPAPRHPARQPPEPGRRVSRRGLEWRASTLANPRSNSNTTSAHSANRPRPFNTPAGVRTAPASAIARCSRTLTAPRARHR